MAQAATNRRQESNAKESPQRTHGHFCWNELMTRDIEGAKRFYQNTIGWSFEGMPMPQGGTYWVAKLNGEGVAGLFSLNDPQYEGVPESWMSYLAVDDVDARVTKALKTGAQLMKPIFDVPNVGRIAILREPGGAGVGWMTPMH
jgi:predicted enzyme related to lactoylglutathione lyase